jgi:hypothetical protein
MTLYASIDGVQILDARIVVPRYGAWFAELALSSEKTISGPHTLTVGDIAWKCAAWRGAPYQGRTSLRVIGGSGGWQKRLPARAYRSDAGVKLSSVLNDAARECGESVTVTVDKAIGTFLVRDVGPAARMLNRLADEWHMDQDGRTVVGPWGTLTPITDKFDLLSFDGRTGKAEIATEALAAFTPGRSFTSPLGGGKLTIGAATHTISGKKVRTEILVAEVRP